MIDPMWSERYDVVLADPPWSYYGQQDKWGAAAEFYPLMADHEIRALPVASLLTPRSVVFLWATGPRLDFAIQCLSDWGLTYRGMAFVWVKTKQTGEPVGAQGVRPSIVKPTTEFVLAGSPVGRGRPLPLADEGVPQVVMAPKQAHSTKPREVHERIERLYPSARRIELFARAARHGWDVWGQEAPSALPTDGAQIPSAAEELGVQSRSQSAAPAVGVRASNRVWITRTGFSKQ